MRRFVNYHPSLALWQRPCFSFHGDKVTEKNTLVENKDFLTADVAAGREAQHIEKEQHVRGLMWVIPTHCLCHHTRFCNAVTGITFNCFQALNRMEERWWQSPASQIRDANLQLTGRSFESERSTLAAPAL